jgi:signal transduction histidine kinase
LFFSEFSILETVKGPLFYLHTLNSYIVLIIGLGYLFKGVHRKVLKDMGVQQIFYYLGLLLPLMINVLELINLIPLVHDLTPIGFNTSYLVYGLVAYNHQFLDVRKVARYDIYEHMQEGIIILDKNYQVESINSVFSNYMPPQVNIYEGMELRTFIQAFRDIVLDPEDVYHAFTSFIYSANKRTDMEITVTNENQLNHYLLDIQKSSINQGKLIVRVLEVNRYREAIEQLEAHNSALKKIHASLSEELEVKKKLVLAKERNRVSKEVHDTLGHSLTIVISLIEASKLVLAKNRTQSKEKIEMALQTVRYNFNNLKKTLANPNDVDITGEKLVENIKTMIKSVKKTGTDVELITRNYDLVLPPHYYDAVYHMCQEGLTNAIRHGKAQSVAIALRFTDELLDLTIIDNGAGAETFIMGNGLRLDGHIASDPNPTTQEDSCITLP